MAAVQSVKKAGQQNGKEKAQQAAGRTAGQARRGASHHAAARGVAAPARAAVCRHQGERLGLPAAMPLGIKKVESLEALALHHSRRRRQRPAPALLLRLLQPRLGAVKAPKQLHGRRVLHTSSRR